MLTIRQKKAASGPALTAAYLLVGKWLAVDGNGADKHPVAANAFSRVGTLKNNVLAIVAPVGFGVVTPIC